jgi:Osmosensitive K+ channel His kinase sensor domain
MDSMTSELDHKTFTTRGHLRTYLGFAPGVGKTYSMLAEGRRRAEGGERVVIGYRGRGESGGSSCDRFRQLRRGWERELHSFGPRRVDDVVPRRIDVQNYHGTLDAVSG